MNTLRTKLERAISRAATAEAVLSRATNSQIEAHRQKEVSDAKNELIGLLDQLFEHAPPMTVPEIQDVLGKMRETWAMERQVDDVLVAFEVHQLIARIVIYVREKERGVMRRTAESLAELYTYGNAGRGVIAYADRLWQALGEPTFEERVKRANAENERRNVMRPAGNGG